MKKLITILIVLIPLIGMGQDTLYDTYLTFNPYYYEDPSNIPDEDIVFLVTKDNFGAYLLKTLKEYQEYCYNDSTRATYDFYDFNGDTIMTYHEIDPGFYPGYIGRKTIWEHKQPTFHGFIKWLEEKK